MKKKLKTFYARFYQTGEFRKIEAESEEEARQKAEELFGDSKGPYKVGTLLRNGDPIPVGGIPIKNEK